MSKNSYPKTNLAGKINVKEVDDIFSSKPKHEEVERQVKTKEIKEKKVNPAVTTNPLPIEKVTIPKQLETEQPGKGSSGKVKTESVKAYMSSESYAKFEDLFEEARKTIRQKLGYKLKESNAAEIAILMVVEDYEKNPERVLSRIEKIYISDRKSS